MMKKSELFFVPSSYFPFFFLQLKIQWKNFPYEKIFPSFFGFCRILIYSLCWSKYTYLCVIFDVDETIHGMGSENSQKKINLLFFKVKLLCNIRICMPIFTSAEVHHKKIFYKHNSSQGITIYSTFIEFEAQKNKFTFDELCQ